MNFHINIYAGLDIKEGEFRKELSQGKMSVGNARKECPGGIIIIIIIIVVVIIIISSSKWLRPHELE